MPAHVLSHQVDNNTGVEIFKDVQEIKSWRVRRKFKHPLKKKTQVELPHSKIEEALRNFHNPIKDNLIKLPSSNLNTLITIFRFINSEGSKIKKGNQRKMDC